MGGLQKWGTEDAGEARIRRDGHAQRPLYAIWALSEDLGHGRNAVRTRTGLESRAAGWEEPRESGGEAAGREAPRESGYQAARREAPRESGGEAMVAQTGVAAAGRTAGEPTGLRIAPEGNERRPGRRPGEGRGHVLPSRHRRRRFGFLWAWLLRTEVGDPARSNAEAPTASAVALGAGAFGAIRVDDVVRVGPSCT